MNFPTIEILKSSQLIPQSLILNNNILVLMQQIVDFKLKFRNNDFFSAKLVLKLNQLVLKLYPQFSLIVQIILKLLFSFFKLLSLILEHKLQFPKIMIFTHSWIYIYIK